VVQYAAACRDVVSGTGEGIQRRMGTQRAAGAGRRGGSVAGKRTKMLRDGKPDEVNQNPARALSRERGEVRCRDAVLQTGAAARARVAGGVYEVCRSTVGR